MTFCDWLVLSSTATKIGELPSDSLIETKKTLPCNDKFLGNL
ncbi:hypothetical protein VL20_3599 [Microcystis panniformis FACHB-1757]|uniref:Uncharacterized protein n=1 Tax=Microcystis panniformis FACHB-1757 TaxID=1638788 RepID=A0A0K1S379_9CHRO|nr:hypothetical protein VL20_3599 [Microcystis panniformis FACHB-1757]